VVFLTRHVDLLVEYLDASGYFLGVLEFFRPLLYELPFWLSVFSAPANNRVYKIVRF
jgi:hypothetical protein